MWEELKDETSCNDSPGGGSMLVFLEEVNIENSPIIFEDTLPPVLLVPPAAS